MHIVRGTPLWPIACSFFFFNDTATTEIYTLSLHDALPISRDGGAPAVSSPSSSATPTATTSRSTGASTRSARPADRKSTRLNSSHLVISYAVFCLKKKKYLDRRQRSRYIRLSILRRLATTT